ncbi:MAG: PAS domain S-box protein, partial [Candidatus Limnocylindrales bacterium]
PGALPMILARFGAVVDGQITEARDVPCLRKDGSVLLADVRSSFANVDGVPSNIAFFTDVTELRRSERNLAEAQRIAHIGSWEFDALTDRAQRSDELHRILGVEPGAISGESEAFYAFVHPDDRARVQASEQAAIEGRGRHDLDFRIVRPDGNVRIVHEVGDVIRDAQGAAVRITGTVEDVTERVAAEAERNRLAAAVEQTSDSVVITDLAGTIEYANPAFESISGYRRDGVIGQNPRVLKSGHQSAAFYRALWNRLTRGKSWTGRFINRRADGALYQVEATISPIRDPHGQISERVHRRRAGRHGPAGGTLQSRQRVSRARSGGRGPRPPAARAECRGNGCAHLRRAPRAAWHRPRGDLHLR